MIPPPGFLGGDLLWWRAADGWSTKVCIFWSPSPPFDDAVRIDARLFDADGNEAARWDHPLTPGAIVLIDSATEGPWQAAGKIEGVLALCVRTEGEASEQARREYRRLYPYVDWHGPGGEVASLHSDQAMRPDERERAQRITEIVVSESAGESNSLVILNGFVEQQAGALELEVRNTVGEVRKLRADASMKPFTVNRVGLKDLAPDLVQFGAAAPLAVSGTFHSRGLFTRPYVVTTGNTTGAYHAGDVYAWLPLPRFAHDLVGGEVNPVAVIEADGIRTYVHVLHSHGDVEETVAVDVTLYDGDGNVVAHRPRWTEARRGAVSTFAISGLIDGARGFRGHVALRFSPDAGREVPRRLQALVEYRGASSVARVMAWSDEWNSVVRVARRRRNPAAPRAFCRVVASQECETQIAVTNAGHDRHDLVADVEFTLAATRGVIATARRNIAPYATLWASIADLFPHSDVGKLPGGCAVLIAQSESDLASIVFTRSRSGLAAEHFLPVPEVGPDGRWVSVAGQ